MSVGACSSSEGNALAAQQVAHGLRLEREIEAGDVVGGRIALRAHADALDQVAGLDRRQLPQALVGRHRHQPLQQRAERGLLSVGQRLGLGGDGIVGARLDGVVADREHGVGGWRRGRGSIYAVQGQSAGAERQRSHHGRTAWPARAARFPCPICWRFPSPAFRPAAASTAAQVPDPTGLAPVSAMPRILLGPWGESWERRTRDRHASRRHNRPPISYRDSGVDIDAGNALVEAIKPLAGSTRRPGAGADLGGFGALFDLKAAGFVDPILVAANDGVGTKLKIAIETGRHATIGIDLVAMCVNDLLAQGAEPLFFLDYFACGKLDVETRAQRDRRHRRGLPAGRLRADRRRDGRDARHVRRRATTTLPASPSAPPSAARCCRARTSPRATC